MLSLPAKERLRYEQREIGILVPRFLEHGVEYMLHLLPYRITVRFNDHTPPHSRTFCKIGLYNQVVIPLGIVL